MPLPTSMPLPNFPLPTQTLVASPASGIPTSAPTGVPQPALPTGISLSTSSDTNVTNVTAPAAPQGQTASQEPVAASS